MPVFGHEVQIVKKTGYDKYELDEQALEQILTRDDIKDLPVVVISVPGAGGIGRSFLLNFILRYLTSSDMTRSNGTWSGDLNSTDPLVGFSWNARTKGILMWSEPLITTLHSGVKVAILLMDGEGFDSVNYNICSALCVMMSSIKIYNDTVSEKSFFPFIKTFVDYGQQLKSKHGTNLQTLHVLVRDFISDENNYGNDFNMDYLKSEVQEYAEINDSSLTDTKLLSSFRECSYYLMPSPGEDAENPGYNGNIKDLQEQFITYLVQFVSSVCSKERLQPMLIHGVKVKARDYCSYFKTCFKMFNTGMVLPNTPISEVINDGINSVLMESVRKYSASMNRELSEGLSFSNVDFEARHHWFMAVARNEFNQHNMLDWAGGDTSQYHDFFNKEINIRKNIYECINKNNGSKAVESAKQVYYANIAEDANQEQFCLSSEGIEQIHEKALEKALETFDASRRKITNHDDPDRVNFRKVMQNQYQVLNCPKGGCSIM